VIIIDASIITVYLLIEPELSNNLDFSDPGSIRGPGCIRGYAV